MPRRCGVTVGARIHDIRVQRGLSLRELARLSGVSHSQLSAIEHGRTGTSVDNLVRIARALDVSLATLTGEDGRGAGADRLVEEPTPYTGAVGRAGERGPTVELAALPAGLADLRDDPIVGPELDDEWVRLLAGLSLHGRRPRTKQAWLSAYIVLKMLFKAEAE